MRIWEFLDYREYLDQKLGSEGSRTGLRKKLAEAIPVHTTFVSQVLKGRNEFSLEQAEAINTFLEHTDDEGEYFIFLLLKGRSENPKLKSRFEKKIQSMRDQRLSIKTRLNAKDEINAKDREKFYSSSIYGAIHVLCSIPKYQNMNSICEITRLSKKRVSEIIDFMLRLGILKQEKEKIISQNNHIHLGNDSDLILKHHANWRLHTLSHLQFVDKNDLHYSACLSLSKDDAFKIKESILQNLKNNVDVISKSKEEEAYVMSIDFYNLFSD